MATLNKKSIKSRVRLLMDEVGLNESEFAAIDENEHDDSELDTLIEGKAEEAIQYVYSAADASLLPWKQFTGPSYTGVYDFAGFEDIDASSFESQSVSSPGEIYFNTRTGSFITIVDGLVYNSWGGGTMENYVNLTPDRLYFDNNDGLFYFYADGRLRQEPYGFQVTRDRGFVDDHIVVWASASIDTVWRWDGVRLSGWNRYVSEAEARDVTLQSFAELSNPYCTGTRERPRVSIEHRENNLTWGLFCARHEDDTFQIRYLSKPVYVDNTLTMGEKVVEAFIYYLAGLVCMTLGDKRQQGFFQQAAELMGKKTDNQE